MPRRRFAWTRRLYRQADSLARLVNRHVYDAHGVPPLVRRYHQLWEQHPQHDDPLLRPVQWRYPSYCPDDVPF